jgi:Cu2+-exporting ATPase/Cu+-exporting ATPase
MALRSLHGLLPPTARRVRGDEESVVPTEQLQPGDVIRILPGERIPVDGMLLGGPALIDEQVVTGESLPIEKERGAVVQAGTLSVDGEIRLEATSRADEGFLRKTVDAILRGVATKTRFERLADRISAGFFPLVVVLSVTTWIVHTWNGDAGRGGLAALAVLVIACPCALGLATPMALWAAVGRAAQMQTIVRDPEALIQLSKATDFCFDKTGTLTTGIANVEAFRCEDPGESDRCLQISAALARGSTHPLAEALSHYVAQRCDRVSRHAEQIRVIPGKGIEATVDDVDGPCYLGSRRWLESLGCAVPEPWADALRDGSEVCLAWQHRIRAVFCFSQALRDDAPMVLQKLGRRSRVVVLTGDRRPYAEQQLHGCQVEMVAELLPQQKAERIRERSLTGGRVVMVGDGLNDGPALASATVGIAMGCGTDLSRASSSICLLSDDLSKIPQLVEFSDAVNRVIVWNLVWAFVYNIGGIALAAMGIVNPIVAAMIMVVSSLLVVTNSLRLASWLPAGQRRPRPNGDVLNEQDAGIHGQQANVELKPAVTDCQSSRRSVSTSSDPRVGSVSARRDSTKEFSESLS